MSILQIQPVRREAAKLVIGLAGQTGDGKTYSALLLALGLANNDPEKVGLLDTENRRGSLYSNIFDLPDGTARPFMHGDFPPPHSPARYVQAMQEMAAKGIEVLVIDSGSHEHEGQGGLEEIAHAPKANGDRKNADWVTAKREHKKFMNTMLHLPCHVIICFRAREKFSFKDPNKPVSLGVQPICEKNVMFDMTASFLMVDKGKERVEIKLPECLRHILEIKGYFGVEQGMQLREWVGGSDPIEVSKNILRLAASSGGDELRAAWESLDKNTKRTLAEFKDTLKDTAAHADDERAENANVYTPPVATGTPTGRPPTPQAEHWSDLLPNAWRTVKIPADAPFMAGETVGEISQNQDTFDAVMRETAPDTNARHAMDAAVFVRIERYLASVKKTLVEIEEELSNANKIDEPIMQMHGNELPKLFKLIKAEYPKV